MIVFYEAKTGNKRTKNGSQWRGGMLVLLKHVMHILNVSVTVMTEQTNDNTNQRRLCHLLKNSKHNNNTCWQTTCTHSNKKYHGISMVYLTLFHGDAVVFFDVNYGNHLVSLYI